MEITRETGVRVKDDVWDTPPSRRSSHGKSLRVAKEENGHQIAN